MSAFNYYYYLKKDLLSERVFKHSLVLRKNKGWHLRHLRCLDMIQSYIFVALNVTHLRDITCKSLVDPQHKLELLWKRIPHGRSEYFSSAYV